jgi:hypothetical protein
MQIKLLYPTNGSHTMTDLLDRVLQLDWDSYSHGINPLKLITDDLTPTAYHLAVNERNKYELLDEKRLAIPNIPSFDIPESLLAVAAQLSRFLQFRDLTNCKPTKQLQFTFELMDKGRNID